jgi:hypothetical protein
MSTNAELSGNGAADHELNGNGVADMNGNGAAAPEFVVPAYQGTGGQISRFITPGGHPQDTSNPAFPVFHRKFANPSPLGLMS